MTSPRHTEGATSPTWESVYRRMRNVAAGYSNYCEESGSTRKLEREFEQIDDDARSIARTALVSAIPPESAAEVKADAGAITGGLGEVTDEQIRASAYEHCFKASEMATVGEQLYLFDLARIKRLCAALTPPAPNQGDES